MRWFPSLLVTMSLLAAPLLARASSPVVYLPKADGTGAEVYQPVPLENAPATTAVGLADVAIKKLQSEISEASAITAKFTQNVVELTVDPAKVGDPSTADRALGAVYHTLKALGFQEIKVGGKAIGADGFTRGALVTVYPLVAALGGTRLEAGSVWTEGAPVAVESFYKRLDAQDKSLQAYAKILLEGGPADVRLALVERLDALRFKEKEAVVLGRLEDPDARVRLAAMAHAKRSPSPAALKALAVLVEKDTSSEARLEAVRILVAGGKKEFERYLLLDKLSSSDSAEVISAVKSLAASKDKKFAPALGGLGTHATPSVRQAALDGLKDMGELGLIAAWVADEKVPSDLREAAAVVLSKSGQPTEKAQAVAYLVEKGGADAALTAAKLARDEILIGTVQGLAKALKRSEADIRKTAAEALGKLKDAAGLEALAEALRTATDKAEQELYTQQATLIVSVQPLDQALAIARAKDVTVRVLAIRALAAFSKDRPNPKAIDALKAALKESDPVIHQAAAYGLAHIADEGVAAEMAKLEGDADPEIRAQVAYALARSKQPNADAVLIKYLDDKENVVKEAALEGVQFRKLTAAADKVRWLVAHRKVEVRREAMRALVLLAKPGDPALFEIYAKAMVDEDVELRILALQGLSAYPANDARVPQAIGTPLSDDQAPKALQLKALEALATVGGAEAVEHAVRGLFSDDKEVKLQTLVTLEKLKSDKASRPLQEFILREADADVKAKAEQVLSAL